MRSRNTNPAVGFVTDPNELVSPVGTSDQAGTGLH